MNSLCPVALFRKLVDGLVKMLTPIDFTQSDEPTGCTRGDKRFDPVNIVDRIDELVNDQLERGRAAQG